MAYCWIVVWMSTVKMLLNATTSCHSHWLKPYFNEHGCINGAKVLTFALVKSHLTQLTHELGWHYLRICLTMCCLHCQGVSDFLTVGHLATIPLQWNRFTWQCRHLGSPPTAESHQNILYHNVTQLYTLELFTLLDQMHLWAISSCMSCLICLKWQ